MNALRIRPLKPALQTIAVQELNEVPQRVIEDVETLRDWLLKQPHLRGCTDHQFLLAFLRGTKFSLERAKHKYDRFYTLQASIPEVFNERRLATDPLAVEIVRSGWACINIHVYINASICIIILFFSILLRIPQHEEDTGPCVTIIRAGSYDTSKYKFQDIVRVGSMFGEIMMFEDENATISGYVEIMDMKGITGTHLFALQPELLRKFATYADEAMPTRQKAIHFINVPPAFEAGFNTLKSFFPAKIKSRVSWPLYIPNPYTKYIYFICSDFREFSAGCHFQFSLARLFARGIWWHPRRYGRHQSRHGVKALRLCTIFSGFPALWLRREVARRGQPPPGQMLHVRCSRLIS